MKYNYHNFFIIIVIIISLIYLMLFNYQYLIYMINFYTISFFINRNNSKLILMLFLIIHQIYNNF